MGLQLPDRIIRIINNIIFCQRTSRHNSCLFYNIDNTLKLNLKALEMRRETKYLNTGIAQRKLNLY